MVLRPSYQDKRCNDLAKSSSMEQHSRQENREMAELPENEGGGPFDCAVIAASHLGLDPEPIRAQFTGENGVRSTKLYDAIYKQAEIRELSLPFPRTVTLRAFIEAHPVGKYCVLTNQRPGEYTGDTPIHVIALVNGKAWNYQEWLLNEPVLAVWEVGPRREPITVNSL
jgi:hypothetical protein